MSPNAQTDSPRRALWPDRLIELGRQIQTRPAAASGARGEFWLLLNAVLQQRIRAESGRTGPIEAHDVEDLASDKALDLMGRVDDLQWDLREATREAVIGYVSSVARYGLVDSLRRRSRRPRETDLDVDGVSDVALRRPTGGTDPHASAEGEEFARALVECVAALEARNRRVWFLRVLLEMPSRRIARHPRVGLRPGHVDVVLQRCRQRLRECMHSGGFETNALPPGSFVALWRVFGPDLEGESDG